MIDPQRRWAGYGEKPDYAGLVTLAGSPYTEDAAELTGADVGIVGAPMDDLVSDRPGTCFAPRAIRAASCPPGPHLETGVDAFAELKVVDFGDAPVVPTDALRTHDAIQAVVGEVVAAGALPLTLGGDHSITAPCVRACAAAYGPVGVIHFDTHTDTAETVFGAKLSHGTFMRYLVEDGHVDPRRYAQIGLRGYWPGEKEFDWQRERGITSLFMHDVRELGIREVVERALQAVGEGPAYLTVDIDVLDPAFAPGTGTPEPGGLTSAELLWAVREAASRLDLRGADLVEVIPIQVGTADPSALVGDRIVREILTGVAVRRRRFSRAVTRDMATEVAPPS
jgi:agmatinase